MLSVWIVMTDFISNFRLMIIRIRLNLFRLRFLARSKNYFSFLSIGICMSDSRQMFILLLLLRSRFVGTDFVSMVLFVYIIVIMVIVVIMMVVVVMMVMMIIVVGIMVVVMVIVIVIVVVVGMIIVLMVIVMIVVLMVIMVIVMLMAVATALAGFMVLTVTAAYMTRRTVRSMRKVAMRGTTIATTIPN